MRILILVLVISVARAAAADPAPLQRAGAKGFTIGVPAGWRWKRAPAGDTITAADPAGPEAGMYAVTVRQRAPGVDGAKFLGAFVDGQAKRPGVTEHALDGDLGYVVIERDGRVSATLVRVGARYTAVIALNLPAERFTALGDGVLRPIAASLRADPKRLVKPRSSVTVPTLDGATVGIGEPRAP